MDFHTVFRKQKAIVGTWVTVTGFCLSWKTARSELYLEQRLWRTVFRGKEELWRKHEKKKIWRGNAGNGAGIRDGGCWVCEWTTSLLCTWASQ